VAWRHGGQRAARVPRGHGLGSARRAACSICPRAPTGSSRWPRLLPRCPGTIVVTIPSDVSHLVVRKSITLAAQAKAPVLGLVENMAGLFPGPSGVDLAREAGIPFLGAVPFDPALAAAADRGEPLVAFGADLRGRAGADRDRPHGRGGTRSSRSAVPGLRGRRDRALLPVVRRPAAPCTTGGRLASGAVRAAAGPSTRTRCRRWPG